MHLCLFEALILRNRSSSGALESSANVNYSEHTDVLKAGVSVLNNGDVCIH